MGSAGCQVPQHTPWTWPEVLERVLRINAALNGMALSCSNDNTAVSSGTKSVTTAAFNGLGLCAQHASNERNQKAAI